MCNIEIATCVAGYLAACGAIATCIVAGITIRVGFYQQKYNRITDSIQHFYLRLKSNLEIIQTYFNCKKEECILTYFCNNDNYSSYHTLIERYSFENIRNKIINMLLDTDYFLFDKQLKAVDKKNYESLNKLNTNISVLLKELYSLKGIIPIEEIDDNEYYNKYRPIIFYSDKNFKGEEYAYNKAMELNKLIVSINQGIDKLVANHF